MIVHFEHRSSNDSSSGKLFLESLSKFLHKYHSWLYSFLTILLVTIGYLFRLIYWKLTAELSLNRYKSNLAKRKIKECKEFINEYLYNIEVNLSSRKNNKKILIVFILLMLSLSLFGVLQRRGLFNPEVNSWNVSNYSAVDLISGKYYDISFHPFLYFLILKYWKIISIDPRWLRILPVIFSTLSLIIFYKVVNTFFDYSTTLISTWIYVVSAYRLFWSQQVRQYPLVIFLDLLYSLLFIYATKNNKFYYWFSLSLVSTVGFLIDYSFFWIYLVINGYFILKYLFNNKNVNLTKRWFISNTLTAILLSPFLTKFLNAFVYNYQYTIFNRKITEFIPLPSFKYFLSIISLFFINVSDIKWSNWQHLSLIIFFAIVIYETFSLIKSEKETLVLMIAYVPLLTSLIISKFVTPILVDYQVMVSSIGAYILLASFIAKRKLLWLILCLLFWTYINSEQYINYVHSMDNEDWHSTVKYINTNLDINDKLIFLPPYSEMSYRYFSVLDQYPPKTYFRDNISSFNQYMNIIINNKKMGNKLCFIVSYGGAGSNKEILYHLYNNELFQRVRFKGITTYCLL